MSLSKTCRQYLLKIHSCFIHTPEKYLPEFQGNCSSQTHEKVGSLKNICFSMCFRNNLSYLEVKTPTSSANIFVQWCFTFVEIENSLTIDNDFRIRIFMNFFHILSSCSRRNLLISCTWYGEIGGMKTEPASKTSPAGFLKLPQTERERINRIFINPMIQLWN